MRGIGIRRAIGALDSRAFGVFYGASFQPPRCLVIFSLALVFLADPALAAGFESKTMRAPLSAVEVERPLVIGRGWLELGLNADVKNASGQWSADGEIEKFDDAQWLYTTERLDIRYGIARRAEFWWSVPFHYMRLQNEKLGTDTSGFGLGDPSMGWTYEWLRRDAPTTSVVTDLWARLPAGSESPGGYIGGPNTVTNFIMSTGTADLGLTLKGKRQFGPAAVTGSVAYVRRFSGVVQYGIETEEQQFLGRFKPGDEVRASLAPAVQLGPVHIAAEGQLAWKDAVKVGTTSGGLNTDRYLRPVEGTGGLAFDLVPAVTVNVTRGLDVRGAVGIPLMGDSLLFPLEQVTPTYGYTYSAGVEVRY